MKIMSFTLKCNAQTLMSKKIARPTISIEQVKELFYEELLIFAYKNLASPEMARLIVDENLRKLNAIIGNYTSLDEIKTRLFALVFQDCYEASKKIQLLYEKYIELYYNQVVFYLGYFVGRVKAQEAVKQATLIISGKSLSPNGVADVGAAIKMEALKISGKEIYISSD